MIFVLSKLFQFLLLPDVLLVLLLALAWWRRSRALLGVVTCLLAAILLLPLHQWLLLPLEDRFPHPDPPANVVGIVLLGSAEEPELTAARGIPTFNNQMETIATFVALARRYPGAVLAFSGGSGAMGGSTIAEADVVRAFLAQMGFDRTVIYESTSRDTFENAVLLKREVDPAPGTWLLITAAAHMPRSVGAFRAAGWPVLAWPVAYHSAAAWSAQFRRPALGSHLADLDDALHEWVGLLAYRIAGRTDALFPAP